MDNKVFVGEQFISHCCQCPYSHTEQITTPDSFEHDMGMYCKLCQTKEKAYGVNTYDRLICSDEWHVEDEALVPDWCPFLIDSAKLLTVQRRLSEAVYSRDAAIEQLCRFQEDVKHWTSLEAEWKDALRKERLQLERERLEK